MTEKITEHEPQDDWQQQVASDGLMQGLATEQNLLVGIAAGGVAALIGAGIWALITILTNYQIGWMAIGVGFLVGMAVRIAGKGIDTVFGVVGATMALLGCLLGNLFTLCYFIGIEYEIGTLDVLTQLDLSMVFGLFKETFSPIDLLFYGIAVYEGYRLSFRVEEEEGSLLEGNEQLGS